MSLKEQLSQDLKQAMKDKDTIRKNVVQLIRSGVLQIEKDNKVTLDDEGVLDVIAKQLKQRRDSLPDYERFQDLPCRDIRPARFLDHILCHLSISLKDKNFLHNPLQETFHLCCAPEDLF